MQASGVQDDSRTHRIAAAVNCSRATSSDTYGSGKCMVRGVTQICVRRSVQALAGLWFELQFAWQEMLVVVSA